MRTKRPRRRRREIRGAATAAALLTVFAVGCRPAASPDAGAKSAATPTPTPTPSATPLPLTVTATGLDSTLFDAAGRRVAEVKAGQLVAGPKGGKPDGGGGATDALSGTVRGGTATLYRDGEPTATLAAETLRADAKTRTVVGTGNVRLRALRPDAPAIRADTMTWTHDDDRVVGTGNVLLTREPDLRIPGGRFEADTAVRRFKIFTGGAPATGSF